MNSKLKLELVRETLGRDMRKECITLVLLLALVPCAITGPFTWNPFSDDAPPLAAQGEVSCSAGDGVSGLISHNTALINILNII